MKHLRLIIVLLLAVLLPIRGALAATMLCPEGEGTGSAAVGAVHGHHDLHAGHEVHEMHEMHEVHEVHEMQSDHTAMHHHAGDTEEDDDSPSGAHPATCHLCASGCCMAAMVGSVPVIGQPGPTTPVTFPALTAPVPAFHSGGQDRPPRTT